MSLIEITNLTTIFGPQPQEVLKQLSVGMDKKALLEKTGHVLALDNISLSIEAGEIFVVMGLSGSGKSTLVRHINRLIDPTAGSIRIDGADILEFSRKQLLELRRRRLGMVFQRFGLMPHRTVLENIAYGLEVRGTGKRERRKSAEEWLERVGLSGYGDHYPEQLSGGMQQRVGLARALAAETDIILMDEAFSALDPLIRSELQDVLVNLQSELGRTIVFITHDIDEALRLADRIAILKDGVLVQLGTPTEILLNPADAYVEAFMRDVNRARVLTADTLMQPPELRITDKTIGEALAAMRRQSADVGYVVENGRFAGIVTRDGLEDAVRCHGKDHATAHIADDHPVIIQGTMIEDTLPMMLETQHPVPVVNEQGKFKGVVTSQDVGDMLASSNQREPRGEPSGKLEDKELKNISEKAENPG